MNDLPSPRDSTPGSPAVSAPILVTSAPPKRHSGLILSLVATVIGIVGMAGAYHATFVSRVTERWIRTVDHWTGLHSHLGVNLFVFGVPLIIAIFGVIGLGVAGVTAVHARLSPTGQRILRMFGIAMGWSVQRSSSFSRCAKQDRDLMRSARGQISSNDRSWSPSTPQSPNIVTSCCWLAC